MVYFEVCHGWQNISIMHQWKAFGATLKLSVIAGRKMKHMQLVDDINDYIKFYNTQRYQTKLNSLTPEEYRNQAA